MVPLSHLAIEGIGTVEQLARRFADVTLVDDLGRVCLDRPTARQLIAEQQAAQAAAVAAERERAERDRLEREHRAAIRQAEAEARETRTKRQREILANDPTLSAYEVMLADSGDHERRMDRAGRRWEALAAGRSEGYIINPPHPRKD